MDEQAKRWQDLTGEARWEVIEQARRGQIQVTELCRSFGISRQTLYRAMETADRAAKEALAPKPPGRKRKPADRTELEALRQELAFREQELARWQQKFEVAKTLLGLERKLAKGEALPGEQKKTPGPELNGYVGRYRPWPTSRDGDRE